MSLNIQDELLQKLQNQERLLKEKIQQGAVNVEGLPGGLEGEFVLEDLAITPTTTASSTPKDHQKVLEELNKKVDSVINTTVESQVSASPSVQRERVKENTLTPYHDEFGNETFYVKNITNGHVIITGIGIDSIPKGSVVDLLEYTDLKTLKESYHLRRALSENSGKPLLKRLTVEQYRKEKELKSFTQSKISQMKKEIYVEEAKKEGKNVTNPIRPVVLAQLEKLSLGKKPETKAQGITPLEFIEWMESENFTVDELDHILSLVQDTDVKMYVIQRKQLL
jgi:hypothetical protein